MERDRGRYHSPRRRHPGSGSYSYPRNEVQTVWKSGSTEEKDESDRLSPVQRKVCTVTGLDTRGLPASVLVRRARCSVRLEQSYIKMVASSAECKFWFMSRESATPSTRKVAAHI